MIAATDSKVTERIVLADAIERLESPYRQVVMLKYLEDFTITEVARVLERPEGTVKTWLHKIEGQRFTVQQVTLFPTRIAVEFEIDPMNSKEIFAFHQLAIMNEKGERLTSYMTSGVTNETRTAYFYSNFFEKPQSLTLVGEHLNALDKQQMTLQISLHDQKVLKAPTD